MADNQEWRVSLTLAGVGILGAVLGSAVTHFLALEGERSKAFEERQAEAFVAFLSAFEKDRMSKNMRDQGRKTEAEELKKQYELEAGAAVRRIVVFGDKKVVKAMAEWYRRDNLQPCEETMNPELAAWKTMREALLREGQEVSDSDLAAVAGRSALAP